MNTPSQAGYLKRRREQGGNCIRTGKYVKLDIATEIVPALTKLIRKVVKEELERKLSGVLSGVVPELKASLISGVTTTAARAAEKRYKLVFKDDLADTIYRDSKIKGKENDVEVALYDMSNSIVTSGPLSSIKVEICALNGEFGSNNNNNGRWSTIEFKHNTVHQREDKAMLLKGETVITLKEGVGHINITFTGNSKRTRSGRYRLGAIVHSPSHQEHVGEAVSNPFKVKESRGNKKQYPPSPKDEIWRLVNISKDGNVHERLSRHLQIETVEDLLRFDNPTDRPLLQKTFGQSSRKLNETLKHAKTSCHPPPALTCQGQNCHSQNIIINADDDKQHVEEAVPVAPTVPGPMASLQQQGLHYANQLGTGQDFVQHSTSTPHVGGAAYNYDQVNLAPELFASLETLTEGNNYFADGYRLGFLSSYI